MSDYFEVPVGEPQQTGGVKSSSCDCPTDKQEAHWLWSDCEVEGHEESCYVVWCRVCDLYSSDCDATWKAGQ